MLNLIVFSTFSKMTLSSNYYRQLCLFLWLCTCTVSEGLLLLSPSEEALTCEGEQLELTCTTNASILRWTSLLQNEQGMMQIFSRHIASMDMTQQSSSLIVNSTYFNVSRISHQEMVPLVSRLLISPVNISLNGTKWNCTEVYIDTTKTNDAMMASTTINIIGDSSYITNHREVIISVDYGTDNATVFLEWTPKSHTYFNISAEPQLEVIINVTSLLSNAQLTVPYNTHYNVSIMATLCGQYTTATNIEIHYAKCEYPFQARTANDSNSVQVVGYVNPSLEGATINFSCSAGQILTRPKTPMAMCMSNGRWESVNTIENNFICKVDCGPPLHFSNGYIILSNDTTEGSSISFICLTSHPETATVYTAVCNQDGNWEPPPVDTCQLGIVSKDKPVVLESDAATLTVIISSISVSTLTSIIFFLFGYACGWRQRCKAAGSVSGGQTIAETNPVYERVVPNATPEQVDLKLTKNEAYASLNIGLSQ